METKLQFDAIDQGNSRIETTADAVKIIVKNSLLSILKEDPGKTHSTRQFRGLCLDHDPTPPGFKLLMKHLIPDAEVSVFLALRPFCRKSLTSFLGKVFHR